MLPNATKHNSSNNNITSAAAALPILPTIEEEAQGLLALLVHNQSSLRPGSQAYAVTIPVPASMAPGKTFSVTIPIDIRTRYILNSQGGGTRRRMLLQFSAVEPSSLYTGYIAYPQSTSVIRPTLQAYWLQRDPATGMHSWVVVPAKQQNLAQDGASVSVTVTREMVVASNGNVVVAAFAVSQPQLPPSAPANKLVPQVQIENIWQQQPATPATPPPQTPAPPPISSSPPPPVSPSPEPQQQPQGLGVGAIVGIVVGVLAGVALIGVGVYFALSKQKEKSGRAGNARYSEAQPFLPVASSHGLENQPLQAMFESAGMTMMTTRQAPMAGGWADKKRHVE